MTLTIEQGTAQTEQNSSAGVESNVVADAELILGVAVRIAAIEERARAASARLAATPRDQPSQPDQPTNATKARFGEWKPPVTWTRPITGNVIMAGKQKADEYIDGLRIRTGSIIIRLQDVRVEPGIHKLPDAKPQVHVQPTIPGVEAARIRAERIWRAENVPETNHSGLYGIAAGDPLINHTKERVAYAVREEVWRQAYADEINLIDSEERPTPPSEAKRGFGQRVMNAIKWFTDREHRIAINEEKRINWLNDALMD